MKTALPLLFIFLTLSCRSQNYIEYQRVFNRIDKDVSDKNLDLSLNRLDSIYQQYKFVYAGHCIKALQICVSNHDSTRAGLWLQKCFEQGVPLWLIRTNELTKPSQTYKNTTSVIQNYGRLRAIYTHNIDQKLAVTIDSLMKIDQQRTQKVNDAFFLFRYTIHFFRWKKNNKKQFDVLCKIMNEHGFPGEKLIGLPGWYADSAAAQKNLVFYGPYISDQRAHIMLVHYYSNPRRDINDKLLKNVRNGYLPPAQYADLNDFMARWGKGKYGEYEYYNTWHHDPDKSHVSTIDERRKAIGLNSFEDQEKNTLMKRERRKNKIANATIVLE